jgi:uncharacterized membrane protein HdeD (DUF308 family)
MQDAAHALFNRAWWAIAFRGLLGIVIGLLVLTWPGASLAVILAMLGIYLFFDGIFALVATFHAAQDKRTWWPYLLEGLLSIGVGILTFSRPTVVALALLLLISVRCLITGGVELSSASALHKATGESQWALWLGGLASIAFGILLVIRPFAGIAALVWLVGIYALVFGVMALITAFRVRGSVERTLARVS